MGFGAAQNEFFIFSGKSPAQITFLEVPSGVQWPEDKQQGGIGGGLVTVLLLVTCYLLLLLVTGSQFLASTRSEAGGLGGYETSNFFELS